LNEKVVFPFDSRSGPPRKHIQGTKSEKNNPVYLYTDVDKSTNK